MSEKLEIIYNPYKKHMSIKRKDNNNEINFNNIQNDCYNINY